MLLADSVVSSFTTLWRVSFATGHTTKQFNLSLLHALCRRERECKFGAMHALVPIVESDEMVVDGHSEMGIMPRMATCLSEKAQLKGIPTRRQGRA